MSSIAGIGFEDCKYNIVVQNQHGLCPNIGCYIDLVLKIFLVC